MVLMFSLTTEAETACYPSRIIVFLCGQFGGSSVCFLKTWLVRVGKVMFGEL